MISFPFNFDEEELCEHFISFLKSLSLRLDSQTVQFFFIEEHGTFPLLTKAIQFLQYRDPMVRTAAQATILNIFRITDVRAREYSLKEEVIELFVSEVSSLMEGMYTAIVTLCVEYATYAVHPNTKDLTEGKIGDRIQDKLCSHICSMEDWLYYLQDIFSLHIHVLTSSLVEHLSIHYIYPVLLDPLLRRDQWKNCVIYNLATNNNTSTGII
jgi:protein CLEC16A